MCLDIKYDIFYGGGAKINIPENKTNIQLKQEIELLKNRLEELTSFKDMGKKKEEAAINSFKGTVFLQNNHKILISKWIDPEKVIKFNLLFSTNKDGASSSTFHYYCDGVFPTVTVVYDTSEECLVDIPLIVGLNLLVELIIVELLVLLYLI